MASTDSDLLATLLALERQFWGAAGNPDFYEEHFAAYGVMAFPFG